MKKILLVGTHRAIPSGVSTHINQLNDSSLSNDFLIDNFTVGSRRFDESKLSKLYRHVTSPALFAWKLIRFKVDIVHLNTSMDFKGFFRDAVFLIIAKILHRKVVLQLHAGLKPDVFFDKASWQYPARRTILNAADAVVLLSKLEFSHAQGFCAFKSLHVVPNAIDLNALKITKKQHDGEFIFVYIGRLIDTKGVKEGIEALAILSQEGYKNISFKIAGSGPYENELKQLSISLGVDKLVNFLGSIFGATKIQFWQNADLLVFPTYFDEGLPYTILEALASGTPVITTKIGGIPEAIEDGVQGLFVPPKNAEAVAEAIKAILSNQTLLEEMSELCVKRAHQEYSIDRLADQFTSIYKSMLPSPSQAN